MLTVCSAANADIVGRWTFNDGTLNDTSGYGSPANGTLCGGAAIVSDPVRGYVVSLPSRGSYVNLTDAAKFRSTDEFTFSEWIKSTDPLTDGIWPYIAHMWGNWAVHLVAPTVSNGTARGFVWQPDGSLDTVWSGGPSLVDGQWHNVTLVFSASRRELSLYVDYSLIATEQPSAALHTKGDDSPVVLGSTGQALVCLIDDAIYYNTALTQDQVTSLVSPLRTEYLFNGNANDTANYPGAPMNGTLNGTAALTTDGCNQIATFDGTTRCHISAAMQTKLSNVSSNVTMMGWIKPGYDAGASVGRTVMGAGFPFYTLTWTGSAFNFWLGGLSSNSVMALGTVDTWQHVAGTYDGSNIKIYINGVLAGTQAATGSVWISDVPFAVGAGYSHYVSGDHFSSGSEFKGSIDDVRVFGKALSQSEIQQYMVQGHVPSPTVSAGFQRIGQPVNSVQLNGSGSSNYGSIGYTWSMDSGPGTVTFSPSPNVASPIATFSIPGIYWLRLTVSDGCTSVYSRIVVGNQYRPTIYSYDLRPTTSLAQQEAWDLRHMAVCVEGLVNRGAPQVFLICRNEDAVWQSRLTESGGLCEGWPVQTVTDYKQYISLFRSYINGVILYEPDVNMTDRSTSLAASTAAAIEGGIAVRKDTRAGSVYNYLVNDTDGPHLPVLFDLTGKFTGSGTIWQTSTPSTGSRKNDAYIWAKQKYLDTGRCDATQLSYTTDMWLITCYGWPWQLDNLDYSIQNKLFCFDLSPWGDEAPNDEPGQPIGTDRNTFLSVLNACNVQTGQSKMIRFCGFPLISAKYTNIVGGIHGDVDTEWEVVKDISAYNAYMQADCLDVSNGSFYNALSPAVNARRYVQNPAPTYNDLVNRGYINGSGNVVASNYVLLAQGDYDGATHVMYDMGVNYYPDSTRGSLYLNWAINPNMYERCSAAFDYFYRNKTSKDYFIAWDSGAGYINPTQLYGSRSPSGYPSGVSMWQQHCKNYYRMLDYSISGWLLDGNYTLTDTDYLNYAPFSGDGIGSYGNGASSKLIVSGNQYITVQKQYNFFNPDYVASATDVEGGYKSGSTEFRCYRVIWWSPTKVKQLQDVCTKSKFLDAYSFYYLLRYKQSGNNQASNYYRATWTGDNIPRIVATGSTISATISIRNDGWDTWATAPYYLGVAIVPAGTPETQVTAASYVLSPLPQTVAPGGTVNVPVSISMPSSGGTYDVYYDMVCGGVTWFRDAGNIQWKTSGLKVAGNPASIDSDGDGYSDIFEMANNLLWWDPQDGPKYLAGDFGGSNGMVDYRGLLVVAQNWLASQSPCIQYQPGDLNNDCKVTFTDFEILAENWLKVAP